MQVALLKNSSSHPSSHLHYITIIPQPPLETPSNFPFKVINLTTSKIFNPFPQTLTSRRPLFSSSWWTRRVSFAS
jgi:hypothetical protein